MLKTMRNIGVVAVAAVALPALAGSWPPPPPRKAPQVIAPVATTSDSAATTRSVVQPDRAAQGGFEATGGESGWQLSQHKYDFVSGRLVMSEECDHAVRVVEAPTGNEIESARRLSPGA